MEVLLQIVTNSNINVTKSDSEDVWSELTHLCDSQECNITMLKILLKLNENIDSLEVTTKKTILMFACGSKNKNSDMVVEEILKYNPNIDLEDYCGKKAIEYATLRKNCNTIKLLTEHARINNLINGLKSENKELQLENNNLKRKFKDLQDSIK